MGAEAREIRGAPGDHARHPRCRIQEIGGTAGLQRIGVVTFGGWCGHGMGIDEERPGEGLATFKKSPAVARTFRDNASTQSLTATPRVRAQDGILRIARGDKGHGTPQEPH